MKTVFFSLTILLCVFSAVSSGLASSDDKEDPKVERTVAADANVTVTLCVMAGQISVRGWDKNEVRARSADAEQIDLKRVDPATEAKPAKKIDVFINSGSEESRSSSDCQASADVELDVPKGATVQVQTRDGDISIVGVEAAYAGSQNGDIYIENVAQKVEAGTIGGAISLKDSNGRVSLSSAGGGIDAANVKPSDRDDDFEVVSVSGDIQLDQVSHGKLTAKSVTGNINLAGPLSHGGTYGFSTMSGDVTLSLPAEASFRLMARLSHDGEVITDFPLKTTIEPVPPPDAPNAPAAKTAPPGAPTPEAKNPPAAAPAGPAPKPEKSEKPGSAPPVAVVTVSPAVKVSPPVVKVTPPVVAIPYSLRRINAVYGTGDAFINVSSFSGTLRLQKTK